MKRIAVFLALSVFPISIARAIPPSLDTPSTDCDQVAQSVAPLPELDGVWVLGARGRVHSELVIDGSSYEIAPIKGGESTTGEVVISHAEATRVEIAMPGELRDLQLVFRDDDELMAFLEGENGLAQAWRASEPPEWMLGSWLLGFSDNYHLAGGVVTFTADSWTLEIDGRNAREGRLIGLPDRDGLTRVLTTTSAEDYGEIRNIRRVEDDALLMWKENTDQYMLLYRGERPGWMPEPVEVVPNPFEPRDLREEPAVPQE